MTIRFLIPDLVVSGVLVHPGRIVRALVDAGPIYTDDAAAVGDLVREESGTRYAHLRDTVILSGGRVVADGVWSRGHVARIDSWYMGRLPTPAIPMREISGRAASPGRSRLPAQQARSQISSSPSA